MQRLRSRKVRLEKISEAMFFQDANVRVAARVFKLKKSEHRNFPNYAWLILSPVLFYGILSLASKIFPNVDLARSLLWMKFVALSSFVVMGGFFIYYISSYGLMDFPLKNKKWHAKRIAALCLTIFLLIALCIMFFTSDSVGDHVTVILGIGLGSLYVFRGGSLPEWLIEYTQRFNFFTAGTITEDDDSANISPKIYLPVIFSAILIAIIAYFVFI
jgi:multisubunit Na+/H+ antiporter MnhG subunit